MIEIPKRVAENIDQFTGRTWLLPRPLEWWDRDDDRLFLLSGGRGSGKSMVLAWLAGFGPAPPDPVAAEWLVQLRKSFKAAHFCQASSRNISPQVFADSLTNQLTGTIRRLETPARKGSGRGQTELARQRSCGWWHCDRRRRRADSGREALNRWDGQWDGIR